MLSNLLPWQKHVQKPIGPLENIQLRNKKKQAGEEEQSDIVRLASLCPGQELQHGPVTAGGQQKTVSVDRSRRLSDSLSAK